MSAVQKVMQSIAGTQPHQYVLNYDSEENKGGITLMQLRNALWRVVGGKSKNVIIQEASRPEFLELEGKSGGWKFKPGSGVISPRKTA